MTSEIYERHPVEKSNGEIRLVSLMPGFWDDPISCKMQVVSLKNPPDYDTLSYVWGDPENTETIFLGGRYFEVTVNLGSALRHLRQQIGHRDLWVDALCINQKDSAEKSWQVDMMGEIYKSCNTGLLWIGEKSEDSDKWCEAKAYGQCKMQQASFEPISEYGPRKADRGKTDRKCCWHGRRPRISEGFALLQILANGTHLYEIPGFTNLTSPSAIDEARFVEPIQAIGAIMRRPWWHRIWTVQEAVLPPSAAIICGSIQVSLNVFINACRNMHHHSNNCCYSIHKDIFRSLQFPTHGLATFDILAGFERDLHVLEDTRMMLSNPQEMEFLRLSRRFSARKAGDQRDKVYALLGLFPPDRRLLTADYGIETEELNRRLSTRILTSIHEENSLAIMYGDSKNIHVDSFPSWARSFDKEKNRYQQETEGLRERKRRTYSACGSISASVQIISSRTIAISGFKVSKVAAVCPVFLEFNGYERVRDYLLQCSRLIDFGFRKDSAYKAGGTLREAFLRVILGNRYLNPDTEVLQEPEAQVLDTLKEWVFDLRQVSRKTQSVLVSNIDFHILRRRFFTTESGLIGFGPSNMTPGDEVWILFGGRVPFILRPLQKSSGRSTPHRAGTPHSGTEEKGRSDGLSRYCVVGDCYVQGIMNGEAVVNGVEKRIWLN